MEDNILTHFTDNDIEVFWAALIAMVDDNHGPQDTMNTECWEAADKLRNIFDDEVDKRRSHGNS